MNLRLALDLTLAKKSMEDFRKFADEGNGVLLITHDIELALEVADRIVGFLCRKNSGRGPGFGFSFRRDLATSLYESIVAGTSAEWLYPS